MATVVKSFNMFLDNDRGMPSHGKGDELERAEYGKGWMSIATSLYASTCNRLLCTKCGLPSMITIGKLSW